MFKVLKGGNAAYALLFGLLAQVAGCGGGTTGTSSTNELKLAGYAQSASGERLSALPMTVRSANDQSELIVSKTDNTGSFTMELPGSESSVLVEIEGKRSSPIARRFKGSSIVSTVLTLSSTGDILSEGSFEAQVDGDSLCQALEIEGNQLYVKGQPSGPCEVRAQIASSAYPLSTFSATFEGTCNGESLVLSTTPVDGSGRVSIDVSDGINRGCKSLRIAFASRSDPERQVVIPIE